MKYIFLQPKFFSEDSYTYKDVTVWILSPAKTKLNPPHRAGGIVGQLFTELPIWNNRYSSTCGRK